MRSAFTDAVFFGILRYRQIIHTIGKFSNQITLQRYVFLPIPASFSHINRSRIRWDRDVDNISNASQNNVATDSQQLHFSLFTFICFLGDYSFQFSIFIVPLRTHFSFFNFVLSFYLLWDVFPSYPASPWFVSVGLCIIFCQ